MHTDLDSRFSYNHLFSTAFAISCFSNKSPSYANKVLGASTADFIGYVKSYYKKPMDVAQHEDEASNRTDFGPKIDRSFLEQVWKWLAKNSEIRVGDHTGHQHLTLSQVEERNAAIRELKQADAATRPVLSEQANPASQVPSKPAGGLPSKADSVIESTEPADDEAVGRSEYLAAGSPTGANTAADVREPDSFAVNSQKEHEVQASQTIDAHLNPSILIAKSTDTNAQYEIRLYTSEKRMWHALTGHGPDVVKVKPLDFDCLSIIARCGAQGILQHHLTRLSGQDKRSLPSRTDRLHEGGYIIKEQIAVREGKAGLLHTSRCILKRFAQFDTDHTLKPYPTQADPASAKKKKKRRVEDEIKAQVTVSEPRPVPQWTAERSISNQIFDLVDRAGVQGLSMSVSFFLP